MTPESGHGRFAEAVDEYIGEYAHVYAESTVKDRRREFARIGATVQGLHERGMLSTDDPALMTVADIAAVAAEIRDGGCSLNTRVHMMGRLGMLCRFCGNMAADQAKARYGARIVYPSDEWYLCAGRPIPPAAFYEDYAQLENGVGMWRLYEDSFRAELARPHAVYGEKKMDVVTGTMAAPLICAMMEELHREYPMISVTVHPIQNRYFGGNVGVAGLVTATDIISQCRGKLTSGVLGVPEVMLRSERDMFLDSITVDELARELGVKVEILPADGGKEARALLRSGLHISRRRKPKTEETSHE